MTPARPPRRPGRGRDDPDRARDAPRSWGGVARKGARNLDRRETPDRPYQAHAGPPPAWEPEQWVEDPDGPVRDRPAPHQAADAGPPGRPRRRAPTQVAKEITAAVEPTRAPKVEQRLMEAARAFERERYRDA